MSKTLSHHIPPFQVEGIIENGEKFKQAFTDLSIDDGDSVERLVERLNNMLQQNPENLVCDKKVKEVWGV